MNKNAELLNSVYRNSQMGVHTLQHLMNIAQDKDLKQHLEYQYDEYEKFHRNAKKLLNSHGYDAKGINTFDKVKSFVMLNTQTALDRSSSNIAKMLIIGSNMGIIDAIENLNKYPDAEQDITELMENLKKFEEENVAKLKSFL